jgi:hypothetical protein
LAQNSQASFGMLRQSQLSLRMPRRISIAELQTMGVLLQPAEAVAIAQQVVHACGRATAREGPASASEEKRALTPPFGSPSLSSVYLESDGAVTCQSCDAALAVSEVAAFLQALLPPGRPGTMRVPGALRYTIARALLEVDAPPFDSIEEFSQALARHARGECNSVVRGLLERVAVESLSMTKPPSPFDRRRSAPSVADLRHQLRRADTRLYEQQLALKALGAMTTTRARPSYRRGAALAAALAIGLALIGVREIAPPQLLPLPIPDRPSSFGATTDRAMAPALDLNLALLDAQTGGLKNGGTPPAAAPRAGEQASGVHAARKPLPVRNGLKSPSDRRSRNERPGTSVRRVSSKAGHGFLSRLHLRWLRHKFALRADRL